jgi:hypothetical protein
VLSVPSVVTSKHALHFDIAVAHVSRWFNSVDLVSHVPLEKICAVDAALGVSAVNTSESSMGFSLSKTEWIATVRKCSDTLVMGFSASFSYVLLTCILRLLHLGVSKEVN